MSALHSFGQIGEDEFAVGAIPSRAPSGGALDDAPPHASADRSTRMITANKDSKRIDS
jgi:hypothetical protein